MNTINPSISDGDLQAGSQPSRSAASGITSDGETRTRDYAPLVLGLFLLGTIVDYGGGLHVKPLVFILTLLYLLTRKQAYELWLRCLPDLTMVLLIPAAITLVQLCFSPGAGFSDMLAELWRRLGSPSYFLFFPLLFIVGAERAARWLVKIMSILALLTVLVMIAHAAGLIDILQYTEFMMSHRLALFGTDVRAYDLGLADIGLPGFGAAQAFPVGFALAYAFHPVLPIIIALATLLGTQRGQVLGLIVACLLILIQTRSHIAVGLGQTLRKPLKAMNLLIIVVIIGLTTASVAHYMSDVVSLLLYKFELLFSGNDESSSIRFGHIAGYLECINLSPMGMLWGFGPSTTIYNAVVGEKVFMTEMVFLMYLFWYGWIYTLLFYAWIGRGLLGLQNRSRKNFDVALLTACVVLVVIGNVNPVMLTPLAFIFLALLRARLLELDS